MPYPSPLATCLAGYSSVLVGYSGGVDSALVAVVARRVLGRERTAAAIGVSASYPAAQFQQAMAIAESFDLRVIEVPTEELSDPDYVRNAPSRCFFCKRELWTKLVAVARAEGMAVVADGTNADDLGEHRPGLQAAEANAIRSPLAELGYSKSDIRAEARRLGLEIWDAPAAPCLASRLRYGLAVTAGRLRQVERGEALLRSLGVTGNLRVRHGGDEARIEVPATAEDTVRRHRETIASRFLELGFDRVLLDLDGYRRGSQLERAVPRLELLAERS